MTTTDGQYVPSDSEEWDLVDLLGTIIEDANDEPQFTVSEHALMAAGTIRREWLAAHDARVGRAAVREVLDDIIDAWTGKDSTKDTREAAEALMFNVRPQFVEKTCKLREKVKDLG